MKIYNFGKSADLYTFSHFTVFINIGKEKVDGCVPFAKNFPSPKFTHVWYIVHMMSSLIKL